MEGLWARKKANEPFMLAGLGENGFDLFNHSLSESGLFKDIDFTIPLLDEFAAPDAAQDVNVDILSSNEFELEKLPPLEPLQSLEQTGPSTGSASAIDKQNDTTEPSEPLHDIWQLTKDLPPIKNDIKYLTWQNFHNQTHQEPSPTLLSEADPSTFDAAIHTHGADLSKSRSQGRAVQPDVLLKSLTQLGLGRSSVLFPYDHDKASFAQALHDGRASGTTLTTSQSLVNEFLRIGNTQAHLRQYVQKTFSQKSASATAIALAKAISTVQDAVETYLVEGISEVKSLVQLQVLFEKPKSLLMFLEELVELARFVKDEEAIVSVVYDKIQRVELADDMSNIAAEIMRLASRPWLDELQDGIGLSTNGLGLTKQTMDNTHSVPGIKHDFPSFVEQDHRGKIVETYEALRFLQENNQSLSVFSSSKTETPHLEWAFSWQDIERVTAKASAYHDSLVHTLSNTNGNAHGCKLAITASSPPDTTKLLQDKSWLSLDDPDQFLISMQALSKMPSNSPQPASSNLNHAVLVYLSQAAQRSPDPLRPPLSLSFHLSIAPLLNIQHAHLTTAALNTVIHQHSLTTHLNRLHNFHLCSSGIFTTRLTSALFDPDAELAERKKNTMRSGGSNMGLKLGSGERREWPPASSELRLALMNILTDCWHSTSTSTSSNSALMKYSTPYPPTHQTFATSSTTTTTPHLPGDISFALRTSLSTHEIDLILNPNSLYALDFLQLSYTPPPALRPIFTQRTLDMYDRVFRVLLRLLRVNFVMAQLFRDGVVSASRGRVKGKGESGSGSGDGDRYRMNEVQRFRQRANFVVDTVTSQFVFAGIARPWQRLMQYLQDLTIVLANERRDVATRIKATFAELVRQHESAIESIAAALLVRKRQGKAAAALEAVLSDVLDFARVVRDGEDDDGGIRECARRFDDHTRAFVLACTELMQKSGKHTREQGVGEVAEREAEECIRELVERLEESL